ncbi:uncharacterized protein LOC123676398 [Harmonia axyridis]|uniref:uncharacterized protein LOC123676398 n=1 Tax=Harmonia axyridis TaxID=115357 RepID=UPI001E27663A|nr:uncharacterized protein LOC123676398 [Harmonia axyridis]
MFHQEETSVNREKTYTIYWKLGLRGFQLVLNLLLLTFLEDHLDNMHLLSFAVYSLAVLASLGNSVMIFLFLLLRFARKIDVFVEGIWLFCGSVFHLIFGGLVMSIGLIHELQSGCKIAGELSLLVGLTMLIEPVSIILKRRF